MKKTYGMCGSQTCPSVGKRFTRGAIWEDVTGGRLRKAEVEKRQGYNYEHCYAYDWNAMRGYHFLMRIGHLLNVLAQFSTKLVKAFKEKGPQGFIEFVRTTLSGLWLDSSEAQRRLRPPFQLRLLL